MMRFGFVVAALSLSLQAHAQSHDEHANHDQDVDHGVQQAQEDHAGHDEHAEHAMEPQADEHAHHAGPTESERAHVPPEPPANPLPHMSEERMIELMQMEDNAAFGMVLLEKLEWLEGEDEDSQAWDLQAFYGTDYNKLWIETEGSRVDDEQRGRVEGLWDRIISSWWSLQTGIRHDFSDGLSRTWAAVGLQGLAPYFFEIDAALYVGEQGRTALRVEAEYEMLITQRWILQPTVEVSAYGKDDFENGIGSGVSDVEVGLRLRYEIRREIAPYVGVQWERLFGGSADFARAAGDDVDEVSFVAGVRAWF
jgi:copper resistance protein B